MKLNDTARAALLLALIIGVLGYSSALVAGSVTIAAVTTVFVIGGGLLAVLADSAEEGDND